MVEVVVVSVVEVDVEPDVVPFTSDVAGEVDSVVESEGVVLLQATSARQNTNARTPASNLFVSMAFFLSLCVGFVKLNKFDKIIIP